MDMFKIGLIYLALQTNIQDALLSETVQLEGPIGEPDLGSRLSFVCSTSSPAILINWLRTQNGSSQQTIVIQQIDGNNCSDNAPDYLECFCNSTLYTCAIKAANSTNEGESWRCSAGIGGVITFSNNTYTIHLNFANGSTRTKGPTHGWTIQCTFGIVLGCIGVILLLVLISLGYKEKHMKGTTARKFPFIILGPIGVCGGWLIWMAVVQAHNCQPGSTTAHYIAGLVVGGIADIILFAVCSVMVMRLSQCVRTGDRNTEHREETRPTSAFQQATFALAVERPFSPLTQTATSSLSPGRSTTIQGSHPTGSANSELPVYTTYSLHQNQFTL